MIWQKKKQESIKHFPADNMPPRKKFVKAAKMWCVTKWEQGKQIINWSVEEPKI